MEITKANWLTVGLPGGATHTYSINPQQGESPLTAAALSQLQADFAPKPPASSVPTMQFLDAPVSVGDGENRGTPLRPAPGVVTAFQHVRFGVQNVIIDRPGEYELANINSLWARPTTRENDLFRGQGVFINNAAKVTFRRCYFGENGWQRMEGGDVRADLPGMMGFQRRMFGHGAYVLDGWDFKNGERPDFSFTEAPRVRFEQCIFDRNGGSAAKLMRSSEFVDCIMYRNPISWQFIFGTHLVDRCSAFGGGYYWDGTNFTSNTFIETYSQVFVKDTHFVGVKDRTIPPMPTRTPGIFDMGVFKAETNHPQYFKPKVRDANPVIDFTGDCMVHGGHGKVCAGNRPAMVKVGSLTPKQHTTLWGTTEADAKIKAIMAEFQAGKAVTSAHITILHKLIREGVGAVK